MLTQQKGETIQDGSIKLVDLNQEVKDLLVQMFTVEIDFGALPKAQEVFIISNPLITNTTIVQAKLLYEAPTGKELDELEMDVLDIVCSDFTSGTFNMLVRSYDGSYLHDKFKINYYVYR